MLRFDRFLLTTFVFTACLVAPTRQGDAQTVGDRQLEEYFRTETRRLDDACLAEIQTREDWEARRDEYRDQLFDMLGLNPRPEKTPLLAEVTGIVEHDDFLVERIQFQSRPGLYVTGNLYRPRQQAGKLPAILYVCGHGRVKKDGISYGNKVHYQHHGGWFARNGYVCLTIDTLQLGEIEGIHHGTYNHDMWWWNARGYSPAGVEAWNCIRALDYLETRDEVDSTRFGVTGRSGGGAYSWWIAALDERIKAAVPVAGITTLHNHVVDGCVEGHCDCMYMINTFRWDYAQVAALVAPRPLLISNSDKDPIFPLDGVVDLYFDVRRIYGLLDATDRLGLQITEGPHKDTQELRVHAFHWFNRFLKDEDPLIESVAVKYFEPEQLRVFETLPADERNTTIHDTFTATAQAPDPNGPFDDASRSQLVRQLHEMSFRGWPDRTVQPDQLALSLRQSSRHNGIQLDCIDYTSQQPFTLTMHVLKPVNRRPGKIKVRILDAAGWLRVASELAAAFPDVADFKDLVQSDAATEDRSESLLEQIKADQSTIVLISPRGIGTTRWSADARKAVQIRRRFNLLGQTLDAMRLLDVIQALRGIRMLPDTESAELTLRASGESAVLATYAALFEPSLVNSLVLDSVPDSHNSGPVFLNVLRVTDIPAVLCHVVARTPVVRIGPSSPAWKVAESAIEAGSIPRGNLTTD